AWYRDIVAAVTDLPAGEPPHPGAATAPAAGPATPPATVPVASFAELAAAVRAAIASGRAPLLSDAAQPGGLSAGEVTSNAAVVLFGGIETTEGMICNAVLALLSQPGAELGLGLSRAGSTALPPRGVDLDLIPGLVEESLRIEPA